MPSKKHKNIDPLFQLFEHHLLTRSYEDAGKFTKELATEYLAYIDSTLAHVPFKLREHVVEDLEAEAHEMLVKKMYGCMKSADYVNFGRVMKVDSDEVAPFEFFPKVKDTTENPKS